jgi:outer membrane protein assembly factor BamE (lipoprotein component of BamABCDE complex)
MGVGPVISGKLRVTMAGLAVAGLIGACSPIARYHGFVPPETEVAALEIGVTTKDEVISLFGVPAADGALQNNTIYYAASTFERLGPFAPNEVERQVLAVAFDANDRLRNVSRYTLEDGRVVALDRRVTDDGIADVSFLSQLFGSFGRIDAGTLLGQDQ